MREKDREKNVWSFWSDDLISFSSTRGSFFVFDKNTLRAAAASSWVAVRRLMPLTLSIWSPRRSSPLRSAGPPARMKEIKIPSPSSPPTILKPSPEEPLLSTTVRTSLENGDEQKKDFNYMYTYIRSNFHLNFQFYFLDSIVNGGGGIDFNLDRKIEMEKSFRCIVSHSPSHLLSLRERYLILSLKDASSSSRRTKKEGQDDSREILFFSPSLRG